MLLPNGTLSFDALHLTPTAPLNPDNVIYSVEGCYDSAPQLNVYFGALEIPQQMDRAVSAIRLVCYSDLEHQLCPFFR